MLNKCVFWCFRRVEHVDLPADGQRFRAQYIIFIFIPDPGVFLFSAGYRRSFLSVFDRYNISCHDRRVRVAYLFQKMSGDIVISTHLPSNDCFRSFLHRRKFACTATRPICRTFLYCGIACLSLKKKNDQNTFHIPNCTRLCRTRPTYV